ncbi:MAG: TlyA family RNA methyltransferase [Clostridia bacterium]|nr:TlyA family RNA methyltransferase [Clostridia bacterium]MBR2926311.1 TlyA family RNA methyltransferase [Clostridia bacterium]
MRADVFLFQYGHAQSRQRAQMLIDSGCVSIDGILVTKASQQIDEGEHTVSVRDVIPYVGRGGLKLEAALDAFSIDVRQKLAVDIGASTGGFTECLLRRGARMVIAVDSGRGQLAKSLLEDPRVINLEQTNARSLTVEQIGGARADLIVMDVSFISATYILPQFSDLLTEDGEAVCLIKPQFEVGRAYLGKGGVVKDPRAHKMAQERVAQAARECGFTVKEIIPSPIVGGDGNKEFLAHLVREQAVLSNTDI